MSADLMVEIVRFESGHYHAARELWARTPGVRLSAADESHPIMQFLQRNPGLSLVAMLQGEVVGTVLVGHDGRRGRIHHLAVADHAQRQGVGRRLVREAMQGLAAAGIGRCDLLVFSNNLAGRAFWEAIGAESRRSLAIYALATQGAARDRGAARASPRGEAVPVAPHRRRHGFGAVASGLLALVAVYVALTLEGAPKADFDVKGVLWIVAATLGFWAVWCAIRARVG